MARVAIIADDLTGALDTAAPFACHGLRVRAALAPGTVDEALVSGPDVLAITTNSRALSGDRAASLARQAAERLLPWRPDLVLKKVDSRLKGNIADETAAIAETFGFSRIVAVPAVPEQGRLVEDGYVVGRGVEEPLRIVDRLPSGFASSVRDARSDGDLDCIVAEWRAEDGPLHVCARGLAAAFARRLATGANPTPFLAKPPVVLAIGSRDPITLRQISSLCSARPDATMIEAPAGRLPSGQPGGSLSIFLCTGDMTEPPAFVAEAFARSVTTEVHRLKPSTMLLSGGDTALAVIRALGAKTLEIRGEAAPGLPWFELTKSDGWSMTIVSKSGGFGSEDILARLFGHGEAVEGRMAVLSATAQYRE